jgi:hypothetical protein
MCAIGLTCNPLVLEYEGHGTVVLILLKIK